jgi:calcineurin-like phosphoesterase family protein
MSNVYVISDLHFSHRNMAIKRGFQTTEEHDEHIIEQWNQTVNKKDTVWILGDISMEKSGPYALLCRLNGIKKVVLGNHDQPQHVPEMLRYVRSVCGMVKYKGFILTHCPMHESEVGRFTKNIHGHVHENSLDDDRYINVSCEVVDYRPVLIRDIENREKKYTPVLMSGPNEELWFYTSEGAWEYIYSRSCDSCKENPEFDACSAEWDVWTREEYNKYKT